MPGEAEEVGPPQLEPAVGPAANPPAGETGSRDWWEDLPDPWDRPYQHADTPTTVLPAVSSKGRRRARQPVSLRQAALLALLVGTVLIGGGAVVRLATDQPLRALPPPTPPERLVGTSAAPQPTLRPDDRPTSRADRNARAAPAVPVAPSTPGPEPTPSAPVTTAPPAAGEPSPEAEPLETVSSGYEAESAALRGLARRYQDSAASGGEAVTGIGLWRFSYLEFPEVVVADPGEYQLTFHYLGTGSRTGEFRINGGPYVAVDFPNPGNGTVGVVTVTVELAAGSNRIWFGANGQRGPNLDRITVTG